MTGAGSAWPRPIRYVHEAAVYDSDDELVRLVTAHLGAGIAAGAPSFAALSEPHVELVRDAFDGSGVMFLPELGRDDRPAQVVKRLRSTLLGAATDLAEPMRVVQTIPHPGLGAPWDGWCRFEAAINDLLAELPAWEICLYDRRLTPDRVLDDVERTHPRLAANGGHHHNDRYEEPRAFVLGLEPLHDPLEDDVPLVELVDPTPAAGRAAVRSAAAATGLRSDDVEHLVVATSEAITNALLHGQRPLTVKLWANPTRMFVTVHDRGSGPSDPYVGLVPRAAEPGEGGLGLWLVEQLLPVTYDRRDGFTIRLAAGELAPFA